MSKPSRSVKSSKQSRKEPPESRSHMLVVGERLMRAGSEGNLVRSRPAQQPLSTQADSMAEPVKSNQRLDSHEDLESHSRKPSSADEVDQPEPWSSCTVPRRHTVGGPRTAGDVIAMQPYNTDLKKEAFLEHLKQKYPHHVSVIMGHQERLREQIRGSVYGATSQSAFGEPGDTLSLASLNSSQTMSEEETPSAFTRGIRTRASLPVVKSPNQTKDRSLGVLYLQYNEETKQVRLPNELTGLDTIRALFVRAFPQHLTMKTLESPNVAIYIKDDMRNIYYELPDVRSITSQSCLKVYHKDPAQAFSHSSRAGTADTRITRERLYGSRQHPGGHSPIHTISGPHSSIHPLHGSMSPPTPRSMPSSPSRMPYGHSAPLTAGATLPRERLSSMPPSRSITPCPSAILERRDVKPDEDVNNKSVVLYGEQYGQPEARLSIASSQGSHSGDVPDGAAYIQHRSSIKSAGAYMEGQDQQLTLYRQKSRKYSESQLTSVCPKTPPGSPQRINEVRMIDMHPAQNSHIPSQGVAVERVSPVRRSFRKDSNGTIEALNRARGKFGSTSSPVFTDLPPGHGERPFPGHMSAEDPQSERIKAMEQQIASLTGLVQHALFKGSNTSANGTSSEKSESLGSPTHIMSNTGLLTSPFIPVDTVGDGDGAEAKNPTVLKDAWFVHSQSAVKDSALCSSLSTFRRNVSDLRLQLNLLKQTQIQNQETMRLMLREAELVISEKVADTLLLREDPVHIQKLHVEEERNRYLRVQEKALLQLGALENDVENLRRESISSMSQRPVTVGDVEKVAVNLRTVGEALTMLKGEYPALQLKMRSVLRTEVDAVHFLKEEPHRMDTMLRRVQYLTETLNGLRRHAFENQNHVSDQVHVRAGSSDSTAFIEENKATKHLCDSASSHAQDGCSDAVSGSPVTVRHVHTPPISSHHPSPPRTPTHGRDSPSVAKVSPRSRDNSPGLTKRAAPQTQEAQMIPVVITSGSSAKMTAVNAYSTDPEESEWAAEGANIHSPGLQGQNQLERLLLQTQTNLIKAIPHLEVSNREEITSSHPSSVLGDEVDSSLFFSSLTEASPHGGAKADKPAQTALEKPQKATIEKPYRASVDKLKPNSDTATKSPPPPPPRKTYPSRTGFTAGHSAEEGELEAPQRKPLRVPPEVKPKPCTPPPVNTSVLQQEEDKTTTELQAAARLSEEDALAERDTAASPGVLFYVTGTEKTSVISSTPDDQTESEEETLPASKTVNQNESTQNPQNLLSGPDNQVQKSLNPHSNPIELKAQSVLKLQKQEVPKTFEQITSGHETFSMSITHVQNIEPERSYDSRSFNSGVTPRSELHRTNTDPLWSLQTNHTDRTCSTSNQDKYTEEASLSPDLPDEEGPPPPNNIAFRVTRTKIQALSTGEYRQLVNSKGTDVQTVKVGAEPTLSTHEESGHSKNPVIIIFDEPMDFHQAYKRLSTVFECEEEVERVLTKEIIDEENEEDINTKEKINEVKYVCQSENMVNSQRSGSVCNATTVKHQQSVDGSNFDVEEEKAESPKDAKKKFKFKFPKKQLAAIGQALRTGSKTGKKTLQVVVYEDNEDTEGNSTEVRESNKVETESNGHSQVSTSRRLSSQKITTSEQLCQSTYQTLDSLEETIKQLENTISDMSPALSDQVSYKAKRNISRAEPEEGSPTKRSASLKSKSLKSSSQQKRTKLTRSSSSNSTFSSSKQNSNDSGASSHASSHKSRAHPGSVEKLGKAQKLQESQKQFRQANGSSVKSGKSSKHAFLALPASKIPTFIPSSWKHSFSHAPNSNKLTNPTSSSSSKSSIPCLSLSWSDCRPPSPSHPFPSGPTPLQTTQNSLACSYSYASSSSSSPYSSSSSVSPTSTSSSSSPSSPSLLSPTAMCRRGRAVHMPHLSSPRSLKTTTAPASFTGDVA